jgi:hypothetical protein
LEKRAPMGCIVLWIKIQSRASVKKLSTRRKLALKTKVVGKDSFAHHEETARNIVSECLLEQKELDANKSLFSMTSFILSFVFLFSDSP